MNIRGLNTNHSKLEIFIKRLKTKPYVIVCSESRNIININEFDIDGYKIYYNESHINIADGVVIYLKEDIKETTEIIEFGKLKLLNSTITLNNNSLLTLTALYRSHDLTCTDFIFNLNSFLNSTKNVKNHLVIGDYNIDISKQNTNSEQMLNNFLEKGFRPGFLDVTRPTNETGPGSCIDNIFIKTHNIQTSTYKILEPFTDHYPLFIDLKNQPKIKADKNTHFYDYKLLNSEAMKIDWNKCQSMQDPNDAINCLISDIQCCLEKIKQKNKHQAKNKNNKPRKDWITKGIIVSCEKKEILYKKLKNNPTNTVIKKEYKDYLKVLNKIIKDAKIIYEKKQIERNSNNIRNLWRIINTKVNKKPKTSTNDSIDYVIDSNENKVYDKKEIAKVLNKFYSEVGENLSKKLKNSDGKSYPKAKFWNNKNLFLRPTNHLEIANLIYELKNKQGGIDKINSIVLKKLAPFISSSLAHIFNLCIEKSIWPDSLKAAEIVPIYKSGHKYEPCNYRPISLISNIAKLLEKVMHKRLYNFFETSKIFSKNQYGFMKKLGTKDALSLFAKKIYDSVDKSKNVAATFLDLAKAFDCVNHKLLLDKLYKYGVRGKPYLLIKSYLSDRRQKVKIGDYESDYKIVKTGVPQGTILGPLFFIIYMNDLLNVIPNESIISYADDTTIITSGNNWEEVELKMNKLLIIVHEWLIENKLTLNVQKTVYITFGLHCDTIPENLNIRIDDKQITKVDSCKYLGIIIDSSLKWDKHIEHLIKKTKYIVYVFYKLSKVMPRETLKIIYYAFFHSIATYGILAWGGAYQNSLLLLQQVQNRLIKLMNKNFFVEKNPLSIKQTFAFEALIYYYNMNKHKYINSNSITRYKLIQIPKTQKGVSDKNSYIRSIKLFNSLPNVYKELVIEKVVNKNKIQDWIRTNTSAL